MNNKNNNNRWETSWWLRKYSRTSFTDIAHSQVLKTYCTCVWLVSTGCAKCPQRTSWHFSYSPRRFSSVIGMWRKSEFPRRSTLYAIIYFRATRLPEVIRKIMCLNDLDIISATNRICIEDTLSTHETLEKPCRLIRVSKHNRGRNYKEKWYGMKRSLDYCPKTDWEETTKKETEQ